MPTDTSGKSLIIPYIMRKLTKFQLHLITTGLELVAEAYKKDIKEAEKQGKQHLFSTNYVDGVTKETLEAVQALTKK